MARTYSQQEMDAALEAISDPARFAEVESAVARQAPALQGILAQALASGGWFDESHDSQVLKAATTPDSDARLVAVRSLLAEEARMGMMVGVALGWALAEELVKTDSKED